MKKIFTFAAVSAALLLSASCEKQEQAVITYDEPIFTAVIGQESTKTTLNDGTKVFWVTNDQININGATFRAEPNESNPTMADFHCVSGSVGSAPYAAIYPAMLNNDGSYEFPATQAYEEGKFNAPMFAVSSDNNLAFKNICGVLRFALKGTEKVKSIAIKANEALCGSFSMAADGKTVNGDFTGKTITLDCAEGVQLNEASATSFYVYLPPQSYSAGMEITFTSNDGKIAKSTSGAALNIERSKIYDFVMAPKFEEGLPEGALDGEFSVSASKKVHFAKGNLYFDGSAFQFENSQYNFKTTIDAKHVSYFFWSKDAGVARESSYNGSSTNASDIFFTNATATTPKADFTVAGVTGKFRTLSNAEWKYLLEDRANASKLCKVAVTIREPGFTTGGSQNCIVIAPDNYTGTIASTYTPAEWAAAEAEGLVCLPAAGFSGNTMSPNVIAAYWASDASSKSKAYDIYTTSGNNIITGDRSYRYYGYAVRLVTE